MANRQIRNPGELAKFEATGRVSTDIPSFAVPQGQAFDALASVAGQLSNRLGKMADAAAQREGALAGLTAGQNSGAAYLQQQAIQNDAAGLTPTGPAEAQAAQLLRKFEGYAPNAYYDTNAFRVGYGSDTVTSADGTVTRVTKGMTVNQADAERDLTRRLGNVEGKRVREQLGDAWGKLPANAQAALYSVGYNYGSLPGNVVAAAKTGDLKQLSSAVAGLSANRGRRQKEAAWILAGNNATPADAKVSPGPVGDFKGLLEKGNIDLAKRPQVKLDDGSVATVRSMSFESDGKEILVPTVSPDGKLLSDKQAIALYHKTGQFLGKFDSPEHANTYAEALHKAQEAYYLPSEKKALPDVPTPADNQPVLSSQPLALRNDGTIRGEAFDASAIRSYSWRVQQGLSTDLFNAYEQNKDDPGAFQAAAAKIRDNYLKDENFQDPRLREVFDQAFADKADAYAKDVASRHENFLRADEQASFAGAMDAQSVELERQAMLLGANKDGDEILQRQLGKLNVNVDAAVKAGTISPAAGLKLKNDLEETAISGRMQGVYDALPNPEAQRQFATSILEDWKEGKGPIAKLPFDTANRISRTLWADATAKVEKQKAANRIEASNLSGLIDDDVTSIERTGKGLDPKTSGLDPDRAAELLGPEKMAAWKSARDQASRMYGATAGMETQSAEDLAQRVALLEPKAGTAGFADQEKVFASAQKRVKDILTERSQDPAAAVEKSFDQVREAAANANPQDPTSMQNLVTARLQAQTAIGIPDLAQEPLTNTEALNLSRSVTLVNDPAEQARRMAQLSDQVAAAYGPHADKVMAQILRARGVDNDMANMGAAFFKRSQTNLSAADRRNGDVSADISAADQAGKPKATDSFPLPNYRQQQFLLDRPELAGDFDKKFGPGAAQRILGKRKTPAQSYQVDEGTVTVNPDGSEDFTPKGK